MTACIRSKYSPKLSLRTLIAFQSYLKNDDVLQKKFKPTKELLLKCQINKFITKNEQVLDRSNIRTWSDTTKQVLEFAATIMDLYNS